MQRTNGLPVSRRKIVAGLCASGFIAACSSGGAPDPQQMEKAQPPAAQGQALATGNMDRWARMVGKAFDAGTFRLQVAGVQPLQSEGERPPDVTRSSAFLVVFEVLAGGQMPGDLIYVLSSPSHVLDVFLGSAATAEFPNRMHAVFN